MAGANEVITNETDFVGLSVGQKIRSSRQQFILILSIWLHIEYRSQFIPTHYLCYVFVLLVLTS